MIKKKIELLGIFHAGLPNMHNNKPFADLLVTTRGGIKRTTSGDQRLRKFRNLCGLRVHDCIISSFSGILDLLGLFHDFLTTLSCRVPTSLNDKIQNSGSKISKTVS